MRLPGAEKPGGRRQENGAVRSCPGISRERMMKMELPALYAIPRTDALDRFFVTLTKAVGSYGQLWLAVAVVLLIFKKTRRTGVAVLISYAAVFLLGQLLLKNVITRPRPCQIDQTFALLIDRPTSSSFPSTHTAWAFGAATAIFMEYKKAGAAALLAALLIAYSRLYLFVHFPTDVFFGLAMGAALGAAADRFSEYLFRKTRER